MVLGRGRVLGVGLVACALASGCGGDDAESQASGGSPSTGGAAGAGGQGGAAGAAGSAGTGGAVSCDPLPAATGDAKFDAVAKWFHDKSKEWKVPGGALVIYADGKLHKMVFGSKKATTCEPVGSGTRFSFARMTQLLTSVVAIRMSLDPKLGIDLDGKITKWMPEFIDHLKGLESKKRGESVTLRHLLSGTSGYWPVYAGSLCPGSTAAQVEGPESLAAFFEPNQAPVLHEPGQMWMTSEPGAMLIGRVLEKATGKQFPALMKEHLSEPAGLTLTFDASEASAGNYGHAVTKICGVSAPNWGGYATTDDIGRLVRSYARGGGDGVLSSAEVALQMDAGPAIAPAVKGVTASMGFHHLPLPPMGTVATRGGHFADANGWAGSALVAIVPGEEFGFAYVHNSDPGDLQQEQIKDHILKTYFPEVHAYDHGRDPATWGEYAGKYLGDDGTLAEVQVVGKELKLTLTTSGQSEEVMLSPGGFVWWGLDTMQSVSVDEDWFERTGVLFRPPFRFYRDASGKPAAFGGWISEYQNVPIPGPFIRI